MALNVCGSHWLRMESGAGQEKNLAPQRSGKRSHSRSARGNPGTSSGRNCPPPLPCPAHDPGTSHPFSSAGLVSCVGLLCAGLCPTPASGATQQISSHSDKGSRFWASVPGKLGLGPGRYLVTEFISSFPLLLFSCPGTPSLLTRPKGIQDSGPQWAWV